jgi:hypothetical protein
MNGKKFFFLSLIILSVAMGMHWQKNRPKTVRSATPARQRTALNLQDLQIQDGIADEIPPDDFTDPVEGDAPLGDGEDLPEDGEEIVDESGETPQAADGDDPIMIALRSMRRNPFERSPYAQLAEELQKQEEIAALPVEKKQVQLLTAQFTATIETPTELVAVIDSRLYRKGDLYQSMTIAEIKRELVSLESGNNTFLIPKHGVNVNIDEDGNYTVVDNFHKN